MVAPGPKLAFDTNLYLRAYRDPSAREDLAALAATHAPRCHLISVVAMEVLAGARHEKDAGRIRRELVRPFERRRRVVSPSAGALLEAGDALAAMRRSGSLPRGSLPGAFLNDVLIAVTCQESGVLLLTHNVQDYERIARVVKGLRFAGWSER